MRIALTVIALTCAVATTASARANHLTDVEYLQAARCSGLAASEALGAMDTASIDALLKAESRGRVGFIVDKADKARSDAERMANRAKPERRAGLLAERTNTCARYFS